MNFPEFSNSNTQHASFCEMELLALIFIYIYFFQVRLFLQQQHLIAWHQTQTLLPLIVLHKSSILNSCWWWVEGRAISTSGWVRTWQTGELLWFFSIMICPWHSGRCLAGDEDGEGLAENEEPLEPTLQLQSAPTKTERSHIIVWQVAVNDEWAANHCLRFNRELRPSSHLVACCYIF